MSCKSDFNPRSDERSDIILKHGSHLLLLFQSTLRRTERQIPSIQPSHVCSISIHAPTNGATVYVSYEWYTFNISIHAPTNGATLLTGEYNEVKTISIHAPTNGATIMIGVEASFMLFQSTLRRTERPNCPFHKNGQEHFNPRSDERSDEGWLLVCKIL